MLRFFDSWKIAQQNLASGKSERFDDRIACGAGNLRLNRTRPPEECVEQT
jgi:hypothetical protein